MGLREVIHSTRGGVLEYLDNTRVQTDWVVDNYSLDSCTLILFVSMDNDGGADFQFDALSYVTVIMFLISEKTRP